MKRKRTAEQREKLRQDLARSDETVRWLRELAARNMAEIERARRDQRDCRRAPSSAAPAPAIATFSDSASPRSGICAVASQPPTTSGGKPSRSAPRTKVAAPERSSSA